MGRQREEDAWNSLANRPGNTDKLQTTEKPTSREHYGLPEDNTRDHPLFPPANTCTTTHTRAHIQNGPFKIYSQEKPLSCHYADSRSQEGCAQQGQEELTLPAMALEARVALRTILRDRIPVLGANGVRWKQSSFNLPSGAGKRSLRAQAIRSEGKGKDQGSSGAWGTSVFLLPWARLGVAGLQ